MSSKSQPERSTSSLSITARLTLLYLVGTLLILACVVIFMLRNVARDLEYEDNDFLDERIVTIQSLIARHPDNLHRIREQVQIDYPSRHTRYLVRLQDQSGTLLLESSGMAALPSVLFPAPVSHGVKLPKGAVYQTNDGKHYLLNAAWAEREGDRYFRLVQVALDVTEEHHLMARYRLRMGGALLAGICLAGGLGVLISRKGLKPLQEMAAQVQHITITDLHQRVGSSSWPTELQQLGRALDTMLGQLESSFARLTEFSANLAHELRTPINTLRVETEIALSRPRTADEYRQTIESGAEELERLSRMISDTLFLARAEQGVRREQLNLEDELTKLCDYYLPLAEERQISLTLSGQGSALVDPGLFQRAAGNLIANALNYTPPGGSVSVTVCQHENSTCVTVQDTGCGISEQDLPLVFDRFYRSSQARHLRPEGSGLGLAIVRSIMELHGGTVTLSGMPGQGTAATLTFPVPTVER